MAATHTSENRSFMMRLRLRLYPHRRYLKWLRRVAQWQMKLPIQETAQWRFCRWVSMLTTDPGERIRWKMSGTQLVFDLDPLETIQMNLYYRNGFQPEIGQWVQQCLKPDALFIDAGANIGIQSLIAAENYRARAGNSTQPMVYAFEPNPVIYKQLAENIRINHLGNIVSAQSEAVSDNNTVVQFYLSSEDNSTSSSMADLGPGHLHTGQVVNVQAITLADFVETVAAGRRVGLLKLDIEGAELLALKGARTILLRDYPTIIMEVYPELMRAFDYAYADVHTFLTALGYSIQRVLPDGTLADLKKNEWPAEVAYGDILCVPRTGTESAGK